MSKEALSVEDTLKLALEALERIDLWLKARYSGIGLVGVELEAITAIKEALAQPEQEPVEWGVDWGKDGNGVTIIKRLADGNIEVLAWEYAPHPPQRTWVGLTDEEIDQGLLRSDYAFKTAEAWRAGVVFAMTKLKEKNTRNGGCS